MTEIIRDPRSLSSRPKCTMVASGQADQRKHEIVMAWYVLDYMAAAAAEIKKDLS